MDKQMVKPEKDGDAYMSVGFTGKDMEAWADFIPPVGNGAPINPDYINRVLTSFIIIVGVDRAAIDDAVSKSTCDKRLIKDVVIARGEQPLDEIAEYYQMNPHLVAKPLPDPTTGQVDYRNFSPFIIVKKDMALAKRKHRKPGKDGKDVHGTALVHAVQHPEGVEGGENTRIDDRLVLSNINGQLIKKGNVLNVSDSLIIKGAVGYSTGNIIFPGNVFIEGPVSDGFKIYSGGSVTIKQTFDVTDVITKGDLTVHGGIIGRGEALLKVGGTLRTKFLENCRVAVRKDIFIDGSIINSNVYSLGQIELGDKGSIIGSEIYAVKGIKAGSIGKKAAKATHIHLGIDFTAQQEKEKNNNLIRLLAAKITRLRGLIDKEHNEGKLAKLMVLLQQYETDQKTATAKVSDLLGKIDVCETAMVEVAGEIAKDTLIEICQVALFVTEPLKRVRIALDKGVGKLVTEPLV
ncbi:polymerase [Spirochaetia bacterium]|nr:polymerase [Spirochaetia bacterium]